ncbi:hypothetical protein MRF4_21940 [Methylobacterium radiotolerans]|uniref:hypothetical protein n=1 Tax=Methylobacterium TaxID=407 RepID=UPI002F2CC933
MRRDLLAALSFVLSAAQASALDAGTAPSSLGSELRRSTLDGTKHGEPAARSEAASTVTLPSGGGVNLSELADPVSSPLVSKFRAILATYEDFAGRGDGKAWTESADVCPAINAAYAFLDARGGGTLVLPPGVARCATPLRAPNMSRIKIIGQGAGAFSISGTELKWVGEPGASILDLRSTSPHSPVTAVAISDLTLNGNGRARTGLFVRGLKNSRIDVMVRDTTGPGVDIDVDEARGPLAEGPLTGAVWAAVTPGSGGRSGTYTGVPLVNARGGTGEGARATITVKDGSVSAIVVTEGGSDYVLGDVLIVRPSDIGGTRDVSITVANCGNAASSFLDTSQNEWKLRVTQQGRASLRAQGVRIGPGSPWLDTNSSQWINVLTLTQEGTGFEIGNADTNEFIFIRADREGRTGIGVDLKAGAWSSPSAARANRFGTISATGGLVARGGPRPSVRNVVAKYNTESGEAPPKWEDGAGVNITDDNGQPIGNTGFTTNLARTVYTPVVARSDSAAARVTATADYRRFGREILGIRLDIKVAGGSGYITASLPCRPFKDTVLTGFDRATGRSVQGRIGFADPTVYIYSMDGTVPPSANSQPLLTGDLECKD